MKKTKNYYCRYCGKMHRTFIMAQLCFDLDMKILIAEIEQKPMTDEPKKSKTRGR